MLNSDRHSEISFQETVASLEVLVINPISILFLIATHAYIELRVSIVQWVFTWEKNIEIYGGKKKNSDNADMTQRFQKFFEFTFNCRILYETLEEEQT